MEKLFEKMRFKRACTEWLGVIYFLDAIMLTFWSRITAGCVLINTLSSVCLWLCYYVLESATNLSYIGIIFYWWWTFCSMDKQVEYGFFWNCTKVIIDGGGPNSYEVSHFMLF